MPLHGKAARPPIRSHPAYPFWAQPSLLGSVYAFSPNGEAQVPEHSLQPCRASAGGACGPRRGQLGIWIYENNRALTRYTFIDMQTVKDAEHYHLDLLGDEMSATIKAVKARHLIVRRASGGRRDLAKS